MSPIALILIACLPHTTDCRETVEHPATQEECDRRAETLQQRLAGTIDDSGYRPIEVTCLYQDQRDGRGDR